MALSKISEDRIIDYSYRPFDIRYLYYDTLVLDRPRPDLYKQKGSLFLVTRSNSRQWPGDWSFVHITSEISDIDMRGGVYVYPLKVNGKPNFSESILKWSHDKFGENFDPENLFGYIYGILYCNNYRKKYASSLKTSFPHIPITANDELFKKISQIGRELIQTHLLSNQKIWQSTAGFPETGSDIIEKVSYDKANGRAKINDKQYFSQVDQEVWKNIEENRL